MPPLLCVLLGLLVMQVAARAVSIAEREVLTDLSGGFCRNYKFGANIVNNALYMTGLNGGILPNDHNGSNSYLVELDLSSRALWANRANATLFSYGGRGVSDTPSDDAVWTYKISEGLWETQQGSVKPVRLAYGAYAEAPEIQAAYWIGGYQNSNTTTSITDGTRKYASGMIQFNTTTEEFVVLDAPFTPVQEGALVYLPVNRMGALLFFGGEVPSVQEGIDAELTPNAWNYVRIYDIEYQKWYKQTTYGNVTSRTQFCASVVHEPEASSWQIYVISGADFESRDIVKDVSYLSVPSFRWFPAGGLTKGRMSHTCHTYGRQIFGIGGRQAWADNSSAGCYGRPAFIYDAQSEVVRDVFDPALSTYSVPSVTAAEIERNPGPLEWGDDSLYSLFPVSSTMAQPTSTSNRNSVNKAAITGGVFGGVAGGCYHRRTYLAEMESKPPPLGELGADDAFGELDERNHHRNEVLGDTRFLHELDSTSPADLDVHVMAKPSSTP
ncbi:hypothetical protein BDW72DRAFT_194807 [Aspergillus terricola var. indicus]